MDCLLSLLIQELHCQVADTKHVKEYSPPWHAACGLARDGLQQEAKILYRLMKQLDKFIKENKIHWVNTKKPTLAQKVSELQIGGGWGTVIRARFATCFSCFHTLPISYFGHCSVQNIWLDEKSKTLLMSLILSVNHWPCTIKLQTFTARSVSCLTSTDKCFRHIKQALFWTHYRKHSC